MQRTSLRWAWLALVILAGCSTASGRLRVDMRTDHAPDEFDRVVVTVEGRAPLVFRPVAADDLLAGVVVGTFDELSESSTTLRAELLLGERAIARRTVVVQSQPDQVVTIVFSQRCAGVRCPTEDAPEATECIDGVCADPRCTPENPATCPGGCEDDEQCSHIASRCGSGRCIEGACFVEPDPERCDEGERCDVELGCIEPEPEPEPAHLGFSPANGSFFGRRDPRPILRWDIGDAVHYDVELEPDCDLQTQTCARGRGDTFRTTDSFVADTTAPSDVDRPTRQYWRVRACAAEGECEPWTPFQYYTIGQVGDDFLGQRSRRQYLFFNELFAGMFGPAERTFLPDEPRFGTSSRIVGDVEGDGNAEVAVGVPGSGAGTVFVFHGPGNTAQLSSPQTILNPAGDPEGQFGAALAGDDINGDGFADLLVGASNQGSGTVYVYFGGRRLSETPDAEIRPSGSLAFGQHVARAGDLDGDGLADIAVRDQDRVWIIYGDREGEFSTHPLPFRTEGYGSQVHAVGDTNGDGQDDLLVADATRRPRAPGIAHLYFGEAGEREFGPPVREWERIDAVCGGDMNGDGLSDIVITSNAGFLVYLSRTGVGPPTLIDGRLGGPADSLNVCEIRDYDDDGIGDLRYRSDDRNRFFAGSESLFE